MIYYISEILENLLGQMDQQQDEDLPSKLKLLFLIIDQNDERFKQNEQAQDEFNLNNADSDSSDENSS